jgi:hypothetical protein
MKMINFAKKATFAHRRFEQAMFGGTQTSCRDNFVQ